VKPRRLRQPLQPDPVFAKAQTVRRNLELHYIQPTAVIPVVVIIPVNSEF
jgi:hypothetical protein